MSKRLTQITLQDFLTLLDLARESHLARHEPIPELRQADMGNIESCLNTPFQKFQGVYLYKGFINKASILFYLLIKNHPLGNGNKRMACLCLGFFCYINNYMLTIQQTGFYNLAKEIAQSTDMENMIEKIKNILKKNIEKM